MRNNDSLFYPYCNSKSDEIMKQQKDSMQRRSAVSISQHLYFVLRIKPGKELVLFLGKGTERDNQAALTTWVLEKIQKLPGWPIAQDDLKLYVKELELDLNELLQETMLG